MLSTSPPSYTLSLHDALPISLVHPVVGLFVIISPKCYRVRIKQNNRFTAERLLQLIELSVKIDRNSVSRIGINSETDRKSTRLNSSHVAISYAVFCSKKKKK